MKFSVNFSCHAYFGPLAATIGKRIFLIFFLENVFHLGFLTYFVNSIYFINFLKTLHLFFRVTQKQSLAFYYLVYVSTGTDMFPQCLTLRSVFCYCLVNTLCLYICIYIYIYTYDSSIR